MPIAKFLVPGVPLILLLATPTHAQVGADKRSVLAPLMGRVRALVSGAQPRAEFATGRDILVGQYRTENYTIRLRDADGQKLPPFRQLGPRPGGFYLQLAVAPVPADTGTHVMPSLAARPWTTVTSVYPLSDGLKAVFMTWEAAPGTPPGLAEHVRELVTEYVSKH